MGWALWKSPDLVINVFPELLLLFSCLGISELTLQPHKWQTPGFSVLHYLPEFAQTHVH